MAIGVVPQAKVKELEEAETRRVALEAAMEAAMAKEAPQSAQRPIVHVSAPPPKLPQDGFDVSAGGFSL